MEIGSGKGEFIALNSQFHPEQNFIGIELKNKRIVTTLKKLDILKHPNVRLWNKFIDSEITSVLSPDSIDQIIIYHPDPWPKKRHHKRRLFQHNFIDTLYYLLKSGNYLHISTDCPDYAEWIKTVFVESKDFINMSQQGYTDIIPENHCLTYFDRLQATLGFEPLFFLYKKI
ncbi:MAG: tRNA (guanosine(46)-N7)-methyltransferase TrmB [Candidatus Cloacimonetes bacterium]|nr:tRNA (guanosine(46)-N7)-methyltransferase TrmB [Candidatus Cloacimonadota bacterium]